MNKYLELAQKVLAESQSILTARQIWDSALRKGYISEGEFGVSPWLTLGRELSREVKQHCPSVFGYAAGNPTHYYLNEISEIWGKLESQAESREDDDPTALLQRIRARDPRPAPKTLAVVVFERDPDVIAFVRLRAQHCCEMCGILGFEKNNGKPYVEVHHLKRLADGGSDIPENAVALCANCHRKLHHAAVRDHLLVQLISDLIARGIDVRPQ